MATTDFYASGGNIRSRGNVGGDYSLVRAGTGLYVRSDAQYASVGQIYASSRYYAWEAFLSFNTSSIPDDDVVSAVTLSIEYASDVSATDFTLEVYAVDFGESLATDDWVPGADISGTLLASFDTSGWSSGWNAFTSQGAFKSAINKTGSTQAPRGRDLVRAARRPRRAGA